LKSPACCPTWRRLTRVLGLVYNAEGKFAESQKALGRAEKLKPGCRVSASIWVSTTKAAASRVGGSNLVEAVRLEPANKQAHTWLGRALWDDGRTEAALEQCARPIFYFPRIGPASGLGRAYRKAADLGIEHVLTGASGTPLVHQVYGDIYKDEHAWENANRPLLSSARPDPRWHGAHFGLGEVALRGRSWTLQSKSIAANWRQIQALLLPGKTCGNSDARWQTE